MIRDRSVCPALRKAAIMLRAHTAPVSLVPSAVSLRARPGRALAPLCAIGPSGSYTSSGLALSGSVMNTSAFTIREDVKVTRSEEGANTTVTIKVRAVQQRVRPAASRPLRASVPPGRVRGLQPAARCAWHGVKSGPEFFWWSTPPPLLMLLRLRLLPARSAGPSWHPFAQMRRQRGVSGDPSARVLTANRRRSVTPPGRTAPPATCCPPWGRWTTARRAAASRPRWRCVWLRLAQATGHPGLSAGGSAEAAPPVPLPQEALRKAQEELEEAERRRKAAAEARESSNSVGLRLPLSPETLRRLQSEGGLAWSKEGPGLDASYSFYNIYRGARGDKRRERGRRPYLRQYWAVRASRCARRQPRHRSVLAASHRPSPPQMDRRWRLCRPPPTRALAPWPPG
jgi:hypothetical protein